MRIGHRLQEREQHTAEERGGAGLPNVLEALDDAGLRGRDGAQNVVGDDVGVVEDVQAVLEVAHEGLCGGLGGALRRLAPVAAVRERDDGAVLKETQVVKVADRIAGATKARDHGVGRDGARGHEVLVGAEALVVVGSADGRQQQFALLHGDQMRRDGREQQALGRGVDQVRHLVLALDTLLRHGALIARQLLAQ